MVKFLPLVALALWVNVGCSNEDEDKEPVQFLPLVGEAVDKARPSGITAAELVGGNLTSTPDTAAEALRDFFNDNVASLGGHTKKGWIDAYIYDLDQRILETKNDTEPECLSSTPVSVAFDTGVGHSLTLPLNCVRSFEGSGDMSGSGSGIAYGRDEDNYYMYVMLAQKANAAEKFGYAAIVNRATEAVDLMFLENNPTFNRTKFFSLKTVPEPKSFAFAVAATGDGPGPVSTETAHTLSAGTRFVANATLLRVEGKVGSGTDAQGQVQNDPADFDATECFDATDLSADPEACPSSAPTFAASMPLVSATEMAGVAETVDASLKTMNALIDAGVGVDLPPPPPEGN